MMAYQKVYMNQIHSSSLLSQLAEMWRRDVLCDAVITTGTVDTKAHRLVLVAACPMLQSMDSASIGNKLEVKLSADISKEAVMSFLQYLYDGFMTLTEDNVRDIGKIARLLQVDSVTKCCNNFYKDLHEKVGQVVDSNAMYCFNADSLDLKHIRTSDLQRLMQNSGGKRVMDTEQISGRKRAKVQKNVIGLAQKNTQEDSFHLIQSQQPDDRQMSQDEPIHKHSLALSVAGKMGSTSSANQVIITEDGDSSSSFGQSLSQTERISATSDASLNSSELVTNSINPEKKSTKSRSFHRPFSPSTNAPSTCKEKVTNLAMLKSDLNYKLRQHKSTVTSKSNPKAQTGTSREKQEPVHGDLVPTAVENDIIIEQMTEEYERLDAMKHVTSTPSSLENSASHSEKKRITSDNVDNTDTDNEARLSPDLSKVKVEQDSFNGLYGIPSGSQDEGHSHLEDNEEEASDTEGAHHGDTSQSSFMADEQGSSWYTQTFKDVLDSEWNTSYNPADQNLLVLDHHKVTDRNGQRYSMSGKTAALPIQQKLIRALANLKSPVVFLRNLQRKLSGGVKIDRLKVECARLASEGFGQFTLRRMSSVLQRDAFFKPAPDTLDENDPFLSSAQVSKVFYSRNFQDISQLTEEEVNLVCAIHPDKEYVQNLCRNVVDPQNFVIKKLEKMADRCFLLGAMHQQGGYAPLSEQMPQEMSPLSCLERTAVWHLQRKESNHYDDTDLD